ncbi:hypothetical protein RUND412_011122 [Rhizina undulata]
MYHRHVCDEVVGDFYTVTLMLKYKTPLFHLLNGNNDVERAMTLIMNNLSKLGTSWAPIKVGNFGTIHQHGTIAFPTMPPGWFISGPRPHRCLITESNGNTRSQDGQGRSIREEIPHKTPGDGDAGHNIQGPESTHQIINRD